MKHAHVRSWIANHWPLVTLLVAVGFTLIGYLAATIVIMSPADRARQAAPPDPSLITETVTKQAIVDSVDTTLTPTPTDTRSFPAATPQGATNDDNQHASTGIILTAQPAPTGSTLNTGSLIAELSGRPLFLLQGQLPAYRDLKPGDSGPDVRQLQRNLRDLKFFRGTIDGHYGPATSQAVAALYNRDGYTAARAQDTNDDKDTDDDTSTPDVILPAAEILYMPTTPATLTEVKASIGQPLPENGLTLAGGKRVWAGTVANDVARTLNPGMTVRIDGNDEECFLTTVGDAGNDQTSLTVTCPAEPDSSETAAKRATIIRSTTPDDSLTVPTSALSTLPDGSPCVITVGRDDALTRVPVTVGTESAGLTQITGNITEGTRVVVGARR